MLLPVDFPYPAFALLIAANGIGSGMFAAPNSSSIMGSVPARQRGAASGMRSTFQNSGTALSIGVFFSVMIAGLASSLPKTLASGLQHQGVPSGVAHQIGSCRRCRRCSRRSSASTRWPPAGGPRRAVLPPAAAQQTITGREFFPDLISGPFQHGLVVVFALATGLTVLAALASALRGGRYVPPPDPAREPAPGQRPESGQQLAPPART